MSFQRKVHRILVDSCDARDGDGSKKKNLIQSGNYKGNVVRDCDYIYRGILVML